MPGRPLSPMFFILRMIVFALQHTGLTARYALINAACFSKHLFKRLPVELVDAAACHAEEHTVVVVFIDVTNHW